MADSFRDVIAWQKAMDLATLIYRVTDSFPATERFGLTRQVRDAAGSVPSNIAEGKGRQTKKDYVQFLYRARGLLFEVSTQLELGKRLNFINSNEYGKTNDLANETGRVLNALIASIERQISSSLKSSRAQELKS